MTTFHVTSGALEGQVIAGGPDQSLPTPPAYVDNTLPSPPPGVWPPPNRPVTPLPPGFPGRPGAVWPPLWSPDPGHGQGHPLPPGYASGQPVPPGYASGQPVPPGYASGQPVPPGEVDNTLPPSQGHPGQGLPSPGQPGQGLPSQKHLVAIVDLSAGGGYRVIGYTVVDPSLDFWGGGSQPGIDQTLPGGRPPQAGQPLPPSASTKPPPGGKPPTDPTATPKT